MPKRKTDAYKAELKRRAEKKFQPVKPVIEKKDMEQAITLFNQGAAPETIEVETGITTDELLKLDEIGKKITPFSDKIKEILANQWYALAERALQTIDVKDLTRVPAKELTSIAAIAQDKAREMEGKSKAVILMYTMAMEKLLIDRDEYKEKYKNIIDINGPSLNRPEGEN